MTIKMWRLSQLNENIRSKAFYNPTFFVKIPDDMNPVGTMVVYGKDMLNCARYAVVCVTADTERMCDTIFHAQLVDGILERYTPCDIIEYGEKSWKDIEHNL